MSQNVEVESAKKAARGKGTGCATILAILFVLVAVVALLGFDIWRVLFNPTLVKQVLTEEIVSSDLAPAVLQVISERRAEQRIANNEALSGVDEPDIALLISFVDADGWREIKRLLVSDEFVAHLISVSVDGLYAWVNSDAQWPDIVWDMTPFKARLTGREGEAAILVAYSYLPECTDEQIADFLSRLARVPPGVAVLYNLCQFPEPWHTDQVMDYVDALEDVNENVAPRTTFAEVAGRAGINPQVLKFGLRLLRFIGQWGWALALILLGWLAALKARSPRSLGKWLGIPLLVTGGLAILIALIGQFGIAQFINATLLSATTPFVRQEVGSSLQRLTGLFFQPLLLEGVILAVIGIVLLVLVRPRKKPAQAQEGQK